MKIAITGRMCSGKTTLANMIKQTDSRYEIFSLGGKVKEVASDLFGMEGKDRSLLISIGAHMREIDSDVWVKYILKKTANNNFCIIDDLRYENEYNALVNKGFKIINLVVNPSLQIERIIRIYPNNYEDHLKNREHKSETREWLDKDKRVNLIINSGEDIKCINQKVYAFLSKLT